MIKLKTLIWDSYNQPHIARHAVTRNEVREACLSDPITWQTHSGRILVLGRTRAGRVLSVVLFEKSEGIYYPVTVRSASRKERRYYQQVKGGEQAA
jgi:uncharacterized DUF497 family protein